MKKLVLILAVSMGLMAASAQTRWYVSPTGDDSHQETENWGNAFKTLQKAISEAQSGDEIWVANINNTPYSPSQSSTYGTTFYLNRNIIIYGGFEGWETSLNARNPNNRTILNGHGSHVLVIQNQNTILDGFIIQNGIAGNISHGSGGGIFHISGNLTLNNIIIKDNYADYGAGIYSNAGSLTITNSEIINNGDNICIEGGGIYGGTSNISLDHTLVSGNKARNGAGIYSNSGNLTVEYTKLINNGDNVCNEGGGVYINTGNTSITNTLIADNIASKGGGIYLSSIASYSFLYSVTIANNTAPSGSAIFSQTNAVMRISSSIIKGGVSKTGNFNQSYSMVEGENTTSYYNLPGNTNPLFMDVSSGNYRLRFNSPCIDAGGSSSTSIDLEGNPRIYGSHSDMGAYEYPGYRPDAFGSLYVKKGGSALKSGADWDGAIEELTTALQVAQADPSVRQILVAAGTYYPTTNNDRTISFELPAGVQIYGGFPANSTNATSWYDRDPNNHETILSGNIGIPDDNADNSYTVVVAGEGSYLDGFIITGGNSNSTGAEKYRNGGGLFVSDYAELWNLKIHNNYGIYGGGIAVKGENVVLQNIQICENSAIYGGGMFCYKTKALMKNINIHDNTAQLFGGGIYCDGNYGLNMPSFGNISIMKNSAEVGGGVYNLSSIAFFINAVICENEGNLASGIKNIGYPIVLVHATVTNNNTIDINANIEVDFNAPSLYTFNSIFCCETSPHPLGDYGNYPYFRNCDNQFLSPNYGNYYLDNNSFFIDNGYELDMDYILNYISNYDGGQLYNSFQNPSLEPHFHWYYDLFQADILEKHHMGNAPDLGAYEYDPNNLDPYYDYWNPFWKNTNNSNKQEIFSERINSDITLSVYPNPSQSGQQTKLFLGENNFYYENPIHVKLYSLEGKLLHNKQYSNGDITLDLPQLSAGMYMINAQTQERKTYNTKLIISQ
jgi:hypothetical protein